MNKFFTEHIIPDDDGKGYTRAFVGRDVEFMDPVAYYAQRSMGSSISLEKDLLFRANPFMADLVGEEFYEKNARKKWEAKLAYIMATAVPPNFLALLTSTSREEQQRLMNGASLTPEQLAAFLFKANSDFGYVFSEYTAEHLPEGIDESKLPRLIHVRDDDKVRTAGETHMNEEELKAIVKYRRVTVAKFLDNGETWHCFFSIYKSLRGEEPWKDGQPHFHYISDKWEIPRAEAVAALKSRRYPKTKVHIALLDYGGKPAGPAAVDSGKLCEAC